MRWAKAALCTLVLSTAVVAGGAPAIASPQAPAGGPPLVLVSQTPWVTPTQPWFSLALGVRGNGVPTRDLHVSVTFFSRIDNFSQFEQATAATPQKGILLRLNDVAVTAAADGRSASTCVAVLPDSTAGAPAPGPGAGAKCAAGDPTVDLGCTADTGVCGDVYPVSVALLRKGSSNPLARFTTFLTYQEPAGPTGAGGPLRVCVIAPVRGPGAGAIAAALAAHRAVPVTVDVSPAAVPTLLGLSGRADTRALAQLADVTTPSGGSGGADQLLDAPYVPIGLAALIGAGLTGEIAAQLGRGTQLLKEGGLHPGGGLWVDTASTLSAADSTDLAAGLAAVGAGQLVLNDRAVAPGGPANTTFAQPFTLDLGRTGRFRAATANGALDSLFTADPGDPTLAADQLLGGLSFVHFENAFLSDPRGVVVVPPAGWQPAGAFMETLLTGLTGDPALTPVTVSQFFAQVPAGGNREPSSLGLQTGATGRGRISAGAAQRIMAARQELVSFSGAVSGHPPALDGLSDGLLSAEAQGLSTTQRAAAISTYMRAFDHQVGSISLASERTVTFTSRTAPIPITVLSSANFGVTVVMSLDSDKFKFPDGRTRTLHLDRPTTSVRVQAQAISSGDRLPIDVTLRTPDGQLVVAHAVVTVHSTAISIVGVALTVLAGLVLLFWWVRTWRRSRRRRPRAH